MWRIASHWVRVDIWSMLPRPEQKSASVVFGPMHWSDPRIRPAFACNISISNRCKQFAASRNNVRIWTANRHWVEFNRSYAVGNNKIITAWLHIPVLFATHAFICEIGDILISGIHFVQWFSRNGWASRSPVATVPIDWFFKQGGSKLYRIASNTLHVNSPRCSANLSTEPKST